MRTRQRGYGAQLGTLIAGIAVLTVFDVTHHPGAPVAPHASVRPTATATPSAHASPAGQAPAGRGATPPAPAQLTAVHAGTAGADTGPGGTPTPSAPGPSPSPTPSQPPRPGLGITAAIVVPLRGATPVAVRAALVVPAAPPFPDLLLQADLNLTAH